MGFLLGLLTGIILTPILLGLVAKPLSKWFLKKKINGFMNDVFVNARSKMERFDQVVPGKYNEKDSEKY